MLGEPLLGEHHHSVGLHPDELAFATDVGSFLAEGLAASETVLVVATPEHQATLDEHLHRAGIDLSDARASARYVTFDAQAMLDRFMVDGRPDAALMERSLGTVVLALADRPRPLRIYGEMVGILWREGNVAGALELEDLWNGLRERGPFQLHCGYGIDGTGAEVDLDALHRLCGAHSKVTTPTWTGGGAAGPDERVATFLPSPHSLSGVRAFVRRTLEEWDLGEVAPDAVLAASELATNAVAHAASPFEIALARTASEVTLRVRDASPVRPEQREPVLTVPGGRGLAIIATLASSWGVDADARGKAVWATFAAG